MSLSFVSSTVQKGTEDGGYEETPIEESQHERDAVNKRNAHKPLFEQLRDNQEEEDAKREETQRQMMRGTRALDEDDVAHLESIQQQRSDRERAIQEQTQSELAMFRAAKAMRRQQQQVLGGDDEEEDEQDLDGGEEIVFDKDQGVVEAVSTTVTNNTKVSANSSQPTVQKAPASLVPKIKVKKRKRKVGEENQVNTTTTTAKKVTSPPKENEETTTTVKANVVANTATKTVGGSEDGGLGSLLAGYGSSSDEE